MDRFKIIKCEFLSHQDVEITVRDEVGYKYKGILERTEDFSLILKKKK